MPFLANLDTRVYKPDEFVVLAPFGFEFELRGRCYQLWVERGFITDFGSMPWLVQAVPGFDVNGASRFASIPHDWLYSNHGAVTVTEIEASTGVPLDTLRIQFTRAECDEIFRLALLAIGRDAYSRWAVNRPYTQAEAALFWSGVRSGGWYYWKQRSAGVQNLTDFVPADYWRH